MSRPGTCCVNSGTTWALGASEPWKVIHRPTCPWARHSYGYFHGYTVEQVAAALLAYPDRAWRWHKACKRCCADLRDLVNGGEYRLWVGAR